MLIQFNVKNWRSIRDEQSLVMLQAKGDELVDSNTFATQAPSELRLLRSAAIYGANAAGKTNVIRGIAAMREIIVQSEKSIGNLTYDPYILGENEHNQPSEFEVMFVINEIKYVYGFTATGDRIIDEWLFGYPNGRAQKWFLRAWDSEKKEHDWEFGTALNGPKKTWQEATRDDSLFLSTAVRLNSKQLEPIYNWFKKTLVVASINGFSDAYTAKLCEDEKRKKQIVAFLKAADLDITDVNIETEKLSAEHMPDSLPAELKKHLLESTKDRDIYNIKTLHTDANGLDVEFDFLDESNGTQKLFGFSGPWLEALEQGKILFIDELNDSLHPTIVKFLIGFFHSTITNPKNAQLIFTTHETSILNQDIFRRDQIWFCEKGSDQATQLFPLTDFSPRKGRENLEEAYLTGRYGALPNVNTVAYE